MIKMRRKHRGKKLGVAKKLYGYARPNTVRG